MMPKIFLGRWQNPATEEQEHDVILTMNERVDDYITFHSIGQTQQQECSIKLFSVIYQIYH